MDLVLSQNLIVFDTPTAFTSRQTYERSSFLDLTFSASPVNLASGFNLPSRLLNVLAQTTLDAAIASLWTLLTQAATPAVSFGIFASHIKTNWTRGSATSGFFPGATPGVRTLELTKTARVGREVPPNTGYPTLTWIPNVFQPFNEVTPPNYFNEGGVTNQTLEGILFSSLFNTTLSGYVQPSERNPVQYASYQHALWMAFTIKLR